MESLNRTLKRRYTGYLVEVWLFVAMCISGTLAIVLNIIARDYMQAFSLLTIMILSWTLTRGNREEMKNIKKGLAMIDAAREDEA